MFSFSGSDLTDCFTGRRQVFSLGEVEEMQAVTSYQCLCFKDMLVSQDGVPYTNNRGRHFFASSLTARSVLELCVSARFCPCLVTRFFYANDISDLDNIWHILTGSLCVWIVFISCWYVSTPNKPSLKCLIDLLRDGRLWASQQRGIPRSRAPSPEAQLDLREPNKKNGAVQPSGSERQSDRIS